MDKTTKLSMNLYVLFFCIIAIQCCIRSPKEPIQDKPTHDKQTPPSETPIPATLPQDKIHVQDNYLVDSKGRVRIFHGINAVLKGPPWYPDWILNDTQLQYFRDWGFNVVRLGAMWSGVNPSEGVTNDSYLDILDEIITKLSTYDMYVILDMHQDVASSYYGMYDGIPKWLLDKLPKSPHPFPWPLPHIGQWADGYLSQACGRTFQQIYDNVNGARDQMGGFWSIVADRFNHHSNVLGYEIINEPWAGDIYAHPTILLPGNAGRFNLQPLCDTMNTIIRQYDETSLIFYEPVTYGVVFNGTQSGSGFTHVPGGGPEFTNRSVLSYHYYCWILNPAETNRSYSPFQKAICDHVIGPKIFETVTDEVKVIGGASFLTEFGLCVPDGHNESIATQECEFVMDEADKHLQSWTYWDSKFFKENGSVDWNAAKAFARPYARIVGGIPRSMVFQKETGAFVFRYFPRVGLITEIFVPELQYRSGFDVEKPAGVTAKFNSQRRVLSVVYSGNASNIEITIRPK